MFSNINFKIGVLNKYFGGLLKQLQSHQYKYLNKPTQIKFQTSKYKQIKQMHNSNFGNQQNIKLGII